MFDFLQLHGPTADNVNIQRNPDNFVTEITNEAISVDGKPKSRADRPLSISSASEVKSTNKTNKVIYNLSQLDKIIDFISKDFYASKLNQTYESHNREVAT